MTHANFLTSGANRLAYHHTLGETGRTVMFLGGFRSDMTGTKALAIEAWAKEQDHGVIRFDYSGHGQSDGRFEDGTLSDWLADALAVIDQVAQDQLTLVGSSMGGWIALLCALKRPERVAGLLGIAAAPDFTERLMWDGWDETVRQKLTTEGRLVVPSDYSDEPTIITRALIEDGRTHLLLDAPIDLNIPIRLIHGMRDPDVPWRHAITLMDALAGNDVQLTLLKEGDHRLSSEREIAIIKNILHFLE